MVVTNFAYDGYYDSVVSNFSIRMVVTNYSIQFSWGEHVDVGHDDDCYSNQDRYQKDKDTSYDEGGTLNTG